MNKRFTTWLVVPALALAPVAWAGEDIDERAWKLLSFFELPTAEKRAVLSRAFDPSGPRVYRGYHAHLDAESRVLVRGLHFLWQMKLKLLREAGVGECLA